jgi:hypothetical protein
MPYGSELFGEYLLHFSPRDMVCVDYDHRGYRLALETKLLVPVDGSYAALD